MEVGALTVHGKEVMHMMREDKTEVRSLASPETKKVATLLANVLTMSKQYTFWQEAEGTLSSSFLLSLQASAAMQVHFSKSMCFGEL